MVIPNNFYPLNAIIAPQCPWSCLEEHYKYNTPQGICVLMYYLLFVTVFIFVVMLPVTFTEFMFISVTSTVAWILLYYVFECIIFEPITSDDLISHTWTLTSITICALQCSCCQEGIRAGFSHSFTTETGNTQIWHEESRVISDHCLWLSACHPLPVPLDPGTHHIFPRL